MSAMMIKIGILAIKTISKPLSKRIKEIAKESTIFRGHCQKVGNFFNSLTHNVNVRLAGGRQIKLKPLAESEAVSIGAEYVGEGFILGVSVSLLVGEYARRDHIKGLESIKKAKQKQQRRNQKDAALSAQFACMEEKLLALRKQVLELEAKTQAQTPAQTKVQDQVQVQAKEQTTESSDPSSSSKEPLSLSWFWPFYVRPAQ
jgi:optic atrophy 3 protein